jgi:hypothetical protein
VGRARYRVRMTSRRWLAARRVGPVGWLAFPIFLLVLLSRFLIPLTLLGGSIALLRTYGLLLGLVLAAGWTWKFDRQAKGWLMRRAAMPFALAVAKRGRKTL